MNELQVLNNPEFGSVRTLTLNNEPWFVGKDVCDALGYKNSRQGISTNVDDEDKGVHSVDTPSGIQKMTIVNESGLYSLIFGSKLQKAKEFKRWVTSVVLPTIRKTGSYNPNLDYIQAAQIVANSNGKSLPYVLDFLHKAGFEIAEIEKQPTITHHYNIINDSAVGFLTCNQDLAIENTPTNVVYAQYQDYCMEHKLGMLSKGEFSKQVKRSLDMSIIDKKINGKKYRIFVKNISIL